tara:strand:+ start:459 stop:686 length:228 start_codon:yes stop_codon:yes gene_type:complete
MTKYSLQELLGPVVLPLKRKQHGSFKYNTGFRDMKPDAIKTTIEKYKVTPKAANRLAIIDNRIRANYLGSQSFIY